MIEILNYNSRNTPYNLIANLLNQLQVSNNSLSSREELFIKDICNRVCKSKSVLYLLIIDGIVVGLVALSVTTIEEQPSLQIDYIFISDKYRGKSMKILENNKPFRYLIKMTISIAEEISKNVGLRYIVLSPDNDTLKEKYIRVGFENLTDNYMNFKLK